MATPLTFEGPPSLMPRTARQSALAARVARLPVEAAARDSGWEAERADDPVVMMVDDEPLNLEVLQTFLEEAGYREFVACSEPLKALGLIADRHPDVVLLDLNMPEMNGLEVLERRRAERLHPHVPIVLVTTESSEDDEARGRAVGAWDYLRKPFQPCDIQVMVRRAREQRRNRGAA